jgi:Lrp/AsnC family leucine-responsive transcriptional regulator
VIGNLTNAALRASKRGLDRIDKLILRELQCDGRKSFSDLAREVHLTLSPCLDRVRRLEESGYIKGYTAVLDAKLMGAGLQAFVEVGIEQTSPDSVKLLLSEIELLDEIIECHMVVGDCDYLIRIRLADIEAYRRFLGERLVKLPGVVRIRTLMVVDEVKSTGRLKF